MGCGSSDESNPKQGEPYQPVPITGPLKYMNNQNRRIIHSQMTRAQYLTTKQKNCFRKKEIYFLKDKSDPKDQRRLIAELQFRLNKINTIVRFINSGEQLQESAPTIQKIVLHFDDSKTYIHHCRKQENNLQLGIDGQIYCQAKCSNCIFRLSSAYIFDNGIISDQMNATQANYYQLYDWDEFDKFINLSVSKNKYGQDFIKKIKICFELSEVFDRQIKKISFYQSQSEEKPFDHNCKKKQVMLGEDGMLYCDRGCSDPIYYQNAYFNLDKNTISFQENDDKDAIKISQDKFEALFSNSLIKLDSQQQKREFKERVNESLNKYNQGQKQK